jgi:N6-adenosine-specific RNA methylase IME4
MADEREIIGAGGALAIPGEITPTSLTLPEDLSYERWVSIGDTLKRMEKSVQWWIGDWLRFGERKYGQMYTQALEATNLEYQTLANAKWVADKVEFSLRRENVPFSHYKEIAALPPDQQEAMLDRTERDELTVRELRQEVKWAKYVSGRMPEPSAEDVPLARVGKRTFDLVYADPPWQYDFSETQERAIENQYPTMTVDEICALPISDVVGEDCVLFLWATAPKLPEAMQVMEAWGFEYRTQMVWVKDRVGMGYYVRNQHELLLIGKRGDVPVPRENVRPSSVLHAPRAEHSRKPDEFYEAIEAMYPDLEKVELFCRRPREGWAVWGLEVESGDTAA